MHNLVPSLVQENSSPSWSESAGSFLLPNSCVYQSNQINKTIISQRASCNRLRLDTSDPSINDDITESTLLIEPLSYTLLRYELPCFITARITPVATFVVCSNHVSICLGLFTTTCSCYLTWFSNDALIRMFSE